MPLTGEAKRQYQRAWVARRRAEYFADKQCVRCGATEDLQLDHIDPRQKVSHNIWSWSKTRREAEIAKCQVLCAVHHREKSLEQYGITNGRRTQHGDYSMYSRHGCRCPICVAAVAPWWREYRAKKRQLLNT